MMNGNAHGHEMEPRTAHNSASAKMNGVHNGSYDSNIKSTRKVNETVEEEMKYILITGGVISGVGKGIIASSLGVILKAHGFRVSPIKIDPYINIDAGTFSPYEHGEVYVLDDGGEVDLDLGNYERFLDVRLRRDNNITTGKIYKQVIDRERQGDYLGKTVQVVPHITDAIQEWVSRVARISVDNSQRTPHVCIIELGGTIGDIEGMPFVEAFRQFQFRVKKENFMNVHVSLVPEPRSTGEQKTKPTQNSVRELRGLGLSPDLVICRSETPLNHSVRAKISNFCHVGVEQVICVHDVSNIYHVPVLLAKQGVYRFLLERLMYSTDKDPDRFLPINAPTDYETIPKWEELANRCDTMRKEVHIALVGKYVQFEDAYTSVTKALRHAAIASDRKLILHYVNAEYLEESTRTSNPAAYHDTWKQLTSAEGVLVPGGFGERGVEGKIVACKWARTMSKPFLGVCLGMQCCVVEMCRNVLGISDANSTEFAANLSADSQAIIDMPEHSAETGGQGMGATMRLGLRTTAFLTKDSKLRKLYKNAAGIDERHRHRYEVNPKLVPLLTAKGLDFVGMGVDEGTTDDVLESQGMSRTESSRALVQMALSGDCRLLADDVRRRLQQGRGADTNVDAKSLLRMEICELRDHPYFVGVQFHPEYLSHPLRPSPPYLGLVLAASGQLEEALRGKIASDGIAVGSVYTCGSVAVDRLHRHG